MPRPAVVDLLYRVIKGQCRRARPIDRKSKGKALRTQSATAEDEFGGEVVAQHQTEKASDIATNMCGLIGRVLAPRSRKSRGVKTVRRRLWQCAAGFTPLGRGQSCPKFIYMFRTYVRVLSPKKAGCESRTAGSYRHGASTHNISYLALWARQEVRYDR